MNTSGILTRRQKKNGEHIEETDHLLPKATKPSKIGSSLGSLNFNINAPDFEEFTDVNINKDLNRGQRRRATKKNDLHEPSQAEEPDKRHLRRGFTTEEEALLSRCKDLQVGYYEELESFVHVPEQQVREINSKPALVQQKMIIDALATNFSESWREQAHKSEQYSEQQREAMASLVDRFVGCFAREQEELNAKCLEESSQPVLRENLVNLLQRDREAVLSDLQLILQNMEESLLDTYDRLNKDYLAEVDEKLSSVLENQKIVVYDLALNNEIVNRSTKAENQFKDKYRRVIEDMMANDQKMNSFVSQNFELEEQLNQAQARITAPLVDPFKFILERGALDSIALFLGK